MRKRTNQRNRNKGFSLVELIVVIAIMAVLVGVLAPQFIGYVAKTRQATDVQNAQTLATEIGVRIANTEAGEDNFPYDEKNKWKKVDDTVVSAVPVVKNLTIDGAEFYYLVDLENIVHIAVSKAALTDPGASTLGKDIQPQGQLYPKFGVNTIDGEKPWYDRIKK